MSTSTQHSSPPLVRPLLGRTFAGVAAGLGRRFDVNPAWFRVAFVILTLFGGVGLVLYAIGWVLIPEEGHDEPIIADWLSEFDTSNTAMVVGIVLIGVAVLTLASGFHLISGKVVFAAVLLVVGVLLYRGDLDRRSRPKGDGPSDDPDSPRTEPLDDDDLIADSAGPEVSERESDLGGALIDDAVRARDEEESTDGGDIDDDGATDIESPAMTATQSRVAALPKPRPPRSILGRLTAAATLIAVGALAILDVAEVLFPDPVHYIALVVGVVGAGLLVGTMFGRARWLIVVGLLLMPLLFLASVGPTWSISREVGERNIRVETMQDLEAAGFSYEHGIGALEIDLREFELPASSADALPISIEADIGIGELRIHLPDDATAIVTASAGIGSINILGHQSAGIGVSNRVETAPGSGMEDFVVDANAGLGSVVVLGATSASWEG